MTKSPNVSLPKRFEDQRGHIQSLWGTDMFGRIDTELKMEVEPGVWQSLPPSIGQVQVIESCKGSIRANHVHATDWHLTYIAQGSMRYVYGNPDNPMSRVVQTGEAVFTPPGEPHAMQFLLDTVMVVLAGNPRDQASYEADTTKVTLV